MYTHNEKISQRQAVLLLLLQMFNSSMMLMPKLAAERIGNDGYLLPIGAFFVGLIYVYTLHTLLNLFKGEDITQFAPKIITKPIGYLLCTAWMLKLIISGGLEVRMFAEMISVVLLPKTPIEVIILVMLFTVLYLISSGIEATGRMAEVVIYFVVIPLVSILLLVALKADYKQIMPFLTAKPSNTIKGIYKMSLIFLPLESLLILGSMLNHPSKIKKIGIKAIAIASFVQAILILLTFTSIGVKETSKQVWPVIALMQSIQLPGTFVENQEILMMAWWVMSIYMYMSGTIYFASVILSQLCHFKRQNVTILPLIPVVFFVAMFPNSLTEAYEYFRVFQFQYGIVFLFIVPLILLVIAKIRHKGDEKDVDTV